MPVASARPVQPSIRRQLAQLMSMLDPRCDSDRHNAVPQGETCPDCGRTLWVYLAAIPQDWP